MRILSVLNFSNRRNPAADSGIRLQIELLRALARKREDYYFYLLVPEQIESEIRSQLDIDNASIITAKSVSRQQGGAHYLDLKELESRLDLRQIDIDVLFINQPELTAGLLDFFNKVHFFDVHSFNYIHWMDWKRADHVKNRWNIPGNLTILMSVLMSHTTGCNSAYGKQRIVKEASRWFNDAATADIERKLVALHPGIDVDEICSARVRSRHPVKTIIYPFRALKYTGFRTLVDHLAGVWKRRQDFRVVVTNPSRYDYVKKLPERLPFLEFGQFDRKQYLRELWKADIVIACHNGSSQWSLAATEALAAECVPLFNAESFLPELLGAPLPNGLHRDQADRYLYYRAEFPRRLEYLLDNLGAERKQFRTLAPYVRSYYDWKARAEEWIGCFEAADRASPDLRGTTQISQRIDAMLAGSKTVSKEELMRAFGWHIKSRHFSWTRYRKYLRSRYNENYRSPIVEFSTARPTTILRP